MSRERAAAFESWARTADRNARTRNARQAGPAGLQYHLDRLHPSLAGASDKARLAAAESARSAYYARLALKSAKARKRGAA